MKHDNYLTIRLPDGKTEIVCKKPTLLRRIARIGVPFLMVTGLLAYGGLSRYYDAKDKEIHPIVRLEEKNIKKEVKMTLDELCRFHGIDDDIAKKIEQYKGLTDETVKYKVTVEKWLTEATKYDDYFQKASGITGLDKDLIKGYILTESGDTGLSPNAVSRTGAVGPAQMFPPAAKESGLKIIKTEKGKILYDERRDPEKAIIASAKYLKKCMPEDDPILGLARYHDGPGAVRRLIKKKENYCLEDIFGRSSKARKHVIKAISISMVAKNPQKYGLTVGKKPLYSGIRENAKIHELKKGETVFGLTRTYPNTTFDAIKKANPAILDFNKVPVGVKVYVPEIKNEP